MNFKPQHTAQILRYSKLNIQCSIFEAGWVNGAKGNVAFKQARLPLAPKPNPCPLPSGSLIGIFNHWQSRRVRELLGDYDTHVSHSRADGNLIVTKA